MSSPQVARARSLRVGIFGGTFDPPHNGHLILAGDAIEALALDRLQVVPANIQPLKQHAGASAAARLAMVQRAFVDLPLAHVDPIEIEREGLSYMVDTAEAYARCWPKAELFLLLGADAAAGLARWRAPERLLQLLQVVILERGEEPPPELLSSAWPAGRLPLRLASRRIDVSSTEIRARVLAGQSIAGFVSESVAAYIGASGLYLSRNAC